MFDNDCDERQMNIFCSIRQQFPSPSLHHYRCTPARWKYTYAHQKVIFPIDQTKLFFSFICFFVTFANFHSLAVAAESITSSHVWMRTDDSEWTEEVDAWTGKYPFLMKISLQNALLTLSIYICLTSQLKRTNELPAG